MEGIRYRKTMLALSVDCLLGETEISVLCKESSRDAVDLFAEEREIGGLGILIVKKMTESMEYVHEDNKNILRLIIALT